MSTTPLVLARQYTAHGFAVVPVPHQQKGPRIPDWQHLRLDSDTLPNHFDGAAQNIGVLLGTPSGGLIDIDLDDPLACRLARAFLPPTPAVFGRSGKPQSHWLYRVTTPAPPTTRYRDLPGATLVELRSDGAQTIFPGSTHPSGEAIEWAEAGKPAMVAGTSLAECVAKLAAAVLLVRHYPQTGGRHDAMNALAGGLLRAGWDEGDTSAFITAVAAAAGDDEATNRAAGVRTTVRRLASDRRATGWPALMKIVGEDVVTRVCDWLNMRHALSGAIGELGVGAGATRHRTDYGNAERLIDRHGPDLHYLYERGMWVTWEQTRWAIDETGETERRAKETVRAIYDEARVATTDEARQALAKHAVASEAAARLRAMIQLAQSETGVTIHATACDADPWLLNCENGTLDLRSGLLRPHDRAELHMKQAAAPYDPDADCPTWGAFLDRIMGGSPALIDFLQRAVGYSLTGSTREQVFFLLHGVGANGKSTFLETLSALVADYGQQAAVATFTQKQHDDAIPNDIARMVGARFISAVEANEGVRLSESLIKQLSGGDRLTARFLHREFFDFAPLFKLWIAVNHRPTIRGTDHAIWRRPLLIPFTVVIPDDEQDKGLKEKLRAELPGILAWTVRGCLLWQRDGLQIPDEVRAATEDYRSEMDTLAGFFEDRCAVDKRAWVAADSLYRAYQSWCEASGERPETQTMFGRRLGERGYRQEKQGGKRGWLGLALCGEATQGAMDVDWPSLPPQGARPDHKTIPPAPAVAPTDTTPDVSVVDAATATPPPLPADATVLVTGAHDRLTRYCTGVLQGGVDGPIMHKYTVDANTVGFPLVEGEGVLAFARRWFGGGEG